MSNSPISPPPSDSNKKEEKPKNSNLDSLGVPVEKSPWLVYALLQIPIVLIMIIVIYFLYQAKQGD